MKRSKPIVGKEKYCDCDLCRAGVPRTEAAVRAYMEMMGAGRPPRYGREIQEHLKARFGEVGSILTQRVEGGIQFEVFVFPPTEERPWYLLATAGLSDKVAHAACSCGIGELRAELMIALPPDWRFNSKALERERFNWPIRLLMDIGQYVHDGGPPVWYTHTMSQGGPCAPNLPFTSVFFHTPELLDAEDWCVRLPGGGGIWFLALVPLHPSEWEYWNTKGGHALIDLLAEAGVTELLDPERKPVVRS